MCGISGIVSKNVHRFKSDIVRITERLKHRGNNEPFYFESENCLLGHQRLSIIDLSQNAFQPMSRNKYTIVFNGEIYNYLELADELKKNGIKLNTNSDTEVLLNCYILWGKECLNKLVGMFSFVIWDNKKIFAARDHLGIKPFYWCYKDGIFAFASEIKGLLSASFISRVVNKTALYKYLTFYSINPPDTIIKDVHSLMPGHYLEYDKEIKIERYWDLREIKPNLSDYSDIKKRVNSALEESVRLRMRSDVPFGAFLSGGLDSATIVGIMSRISNKPIKTFTIGFDGKDESDLARLVASRFKCEHNEIYINENKLKQEFGNFIDAIDQPSGDGINSYLVSQATSKYVNVALSGVGGDEIFMGYRYFQDLHNMMKLQQTSLKKTFPALAWIYKHNKYFRSFAWRYKLNFLKHFPAQLDKFYLESRTLFSKNDIESITGSGYSFESDLKEVFNLEPDVLNAFSKAELLWYLHGMLLRDVDATSMANTLEVRVPFLDKNLVELLLSVPSKYKVTSYKITSYNKPLLVDSFDFIPSELLNVPKKGFEMPVGSWLCKSFKSEMKDFGWLDSNYVSSLVTELYKNPRDYMKVWSLLVLKNWIEHYKIEGVSEEDTLYPPRRGTRGSASEPSIFN